MSPVTEPDEWTSMRGTVGQATPAARAGDAVRIVHAEGLTLQVVPVPGSSDT